MGMQRRKTLHTNDRFKVLKVDYSYSNGMTKEVTHIAKADAVTIIPVYKGKVGIISIERPLINGVSLELPGGRIEGKDKPLEAAKKELREELNLKSSNWRLLGRAHPSISISTEEVHIFVAEITSKKRLATQSVEAIYDVKFYTISELHDLIVQNKIQSGLDGYALGMYLIKEGLSKI